MLSIVHCFSSRLYGLRKYRQQVKQALQEAVVALEEQKINKAATEQCIKNQGLS